MKMKLSRLWQSKKILKLKYLYHKLFGEKDLGPVGLNFEDKPNRQQIVQEIIDLKKYKKYLEIGCFKDQLFGKITCEYKIGVDPVSGGTIRKTSNEFFNSNDEKFDIIFIDGLHYYSQVKQDIKNSLNILNDKGLILLHDCLPNDVYAQAIPRCQYEWNGDVWKAIVECRTKEEIDTYTCYADHGIGVIFKSKNKNKLELKLKDYSNLKFKDYFHKKQQYMNIINFEDLKKMLSA
tara:strand:+ start:1493 stop:2197 length:705 start_codon:yes stop_codon:yes gene_type:complete